MGFREVWVKGELGFKDPETEELETFTDVRNALSLVPTWVWRGPCRCAGPR